MMIRKILMSLLILVAILALAGFAIYQVHAFRETAKAQKNREFSDRVARDLRDALRRKATKSECQELLKSHGVSWSVDRGTTSTSSFYPQPGFWQVVVKDTSWSMLYRGNTYISFGFDESGILEDVVVEEVFSGL